jgi:hypothetical protein
VPTILGDGDRVGVAFLDPDDAWSGPGSGAAHLDRIRATLRRETTAPATGPALREVQIRRYVRTLRRRLPAESQLLCFTPLLDDEVERVVRRLDAHGHDITVCSPDPTITTTVGGTVVRIGRRQRISRVRAAGIRVVDWGGQRATRRRRRACAAGVVDVTRLAVGVVFAAGTVTVAALLPAGPPVVLLAILGIALTGVGVYRHRRRHVSRGVLPTFPAILLAGTLGLPIGFVLVATVGGILVWDAGTLAVDLRQQLSATANTSRAAAVNLGSTAVATAGIATVVYAGTFVGRGHLRAVGVVVLVAGACLLAVGLQPRVTE